MGAAPAKGVRCCLRVPKGAEGLVHQKRELIKSEFASLEIPEIGFEMPARTDKGIMWSIEKVLETARRNLRTMLGGDSGEEIGAFLNKLEDVMVRARTCPASRVGGGDLGARLRHSALGRRCSTATASGRWWWTTPLATRSSSPTAAWRRTRC